MFDINSEWYVNNILQLFHQALTNKEKNYVCLQQENAPLYTARNLVHDDGVTRPGVKKWTTLWALSQRHRANKLSHMISSAQAAQEVPASSACRESAIIGLLMVFPSPPSEMPEQNLEIVTATSFPFQDT